MEASSVQLRQRQPLTVMLCGLYPVLQPGVYVYAIWDRDSSPPTEHVLATFRESEGLTVVLGERAAKKLGLNATFRARWISLTVNSELDAIGLTAEVATALSTVGIPCNVIAALNHDHIFVPVKQAKAAVRRLEILQRTAMADLLEAALPCRVILGKKSLGVEGDGPRETDS